MKRLLMLAVLVTAVSQAEAKPAMNTEGGIQKLVSADGKQVIKCPKGKRVNTRNNGKVSCVKRNSVGVTKSTVGKLKLRKPSLVGPNGQRIDCLKDQSIYINGGNGVVSCINEGSYGSVRRG